MNLHLIYLILLSNDTSLIALQMLRFISYHAYINFKLVNDLNSTYLRFISYHVYFNFKLVINHNSSNLHYSGKKFVKVGTPGCTSELY